MNQQGGPGLSIVIPTLNEAQHLPALLAQLAAQVGVSLEVIVADGGSTDATTDRAQAGGARVVNAPRGRGAQMNLGAARATAEYLLFLHADSGLPEPRLLVGALRAIESARSAALDPEAGHRIAGHFALRFSRSANGHARFFRHMEEKTAMNRRDTINGDQGVLIPRRYFRELGGFDEQLPFLEDQRLAARIFDTGCWIVLPGHLETAARRFEAQGHLRLYTLMAIIMGMHAAQVTPFFERAPRVYAEQGQADRLDVRPYLTLVRRILIEAGLVGAARISLNVGRYVRRQSWQVFFWWDVLMRPLLGPGRYPALRIHDRYIEPVIDNRAADALVAVAVPLWFLCVLPIGYAAADWIRSLRPARTREQPRTRADESS